MEEEEDIDDMLKDLDEPAFKPVAPAPAAPKPTLPFFSDQSKEEDESAKFDFQFDFGLPAETPSIEEEEDHLPKPTKQTAEKPKTEGWDDDDLDIDI